MLIFHKQYDEKYLLIKETLAEAIDTRWLGMQKNSLLRLARRNTFKMYLHYMLGVGLPPKKKTGPQECPYGPTQFTQPPAKTPL